LGTSGISCTKDEGSAPTAATTPDAGSAGSGGGAAGAAGASADGGPGGGGSAQLPDARAGDAQPPSTDATTEIIARPIPGPDCVAPCVWDLIRDCRFTSPCHEMYDGSSTLLGCDETGIRWQIVSGGGRVETTTWMPDGAVCYATVRESADASWVYYGPDGGMAATLGNTKVADGGLEVFCGGKTYVVYQDTAECTVARTAPRCANTPCP
jgi:hypothetical protein